MATNRRHWPRIFAQENQPTGLTPSCSWLQAPQESHNSSMSARKWPPLQAAHHDDSLFVRNEFCREVRGLKPSVASPDGLDGRYSHIAKCSNSCSRSPLCQKATRLHIRLIGDERGLGAPQEGRCPSVRSSPARIKTVLCHRSWKTRNQLATTRPSRRRPFCKPFGATDTVWPVSACPASSMLAACVHVLLATARR